MKRLELRVEFPTGTILVGGHSALPVGASSAHAIDAHGRPVLPATALRGALRENLEAVLRGAGQPACAAGSGVDPEHPPADGAGERPCTLVEGGRCITCRIFGTRRGAVEPGDRGFSSLILGDAKLEGEDVEWSDRQHVAVSRSHRSAEEQRLFMRRAPWIHRRTMVARGHTVDPELDRYLEVAARATKHLGSGRSVGLARVEIALKGEEVAAPRIASRPEGVAAGDLRIRVRLESPTALGTPHCADNYRDARSEIPGSVLRGAIGFALARALPDPDTHEAFQRLVDEKDGAHFGFSYPTAAGLEGKAGRMAGPWPVTARACKTKPKEHGVVDTLLDRLVVAAISNIGEVAKVRVLGTCTRPGCGAPLRGARGSRACPGEPSRRVVTRLAIDRRTSSALDGALHSCELLEPGNCFEGTIRNVPEEARDLLAGALTLPIHVGRGASSGWGKVSVEVVEGSALPPLLDRVAVFQAALRRHLKAAGLAVDDVERLVPLTSLAPLLPDEGDEDGRTALEGALSVVEAWPVIARRFIRDGGWDQRAGHPFAELAVAAGAVYVARLKPGICVPDVLEPLRSIERDGIGRRRHQGYGQFIAFDPFITQRSRGQ